MSVVKQVLDIRRYQQYIKPHQQRIKADAGSLVRDDRAKEFFDTLKQIGIYDSCKLAISPDFGIKTRVSGSNTFVSKGYSLRPETQVARRNLLTYTEEFDNAVWSKTRSSITANAINNPFGVLSADKLIEDTSLAASHFVRISGITVTTTNYSASVYAKASERSQLMLRLGNYWATANDAIFDLSSGTVVNTGNGLVSASITPVGNGWYRCVIVSGVASSGSNGFFDIFTAASGSNATNGDGVSGIYIWGAQLEVGSSASAYQRVIDANSWDGVLQDTTQTTSTSQPHLGNIIAPNERPSLKNPNGQANYLTHPKISFAANEAWSVTTVLNSNTLRTFYYLAAEATQSLFGANGYVNSLFLLFSGSAYYFTYDFSKYTGKNIVVTYSKSSNGNITAYINGTLVGTAELNPSSIDFQYLFVNDVVNSLNGLVYSHIIHSKALTPTQVSQLSNYLMSKYPEIPSVTIGSQVWATSNCEMVATPQGNFIQNVTLNSNVEKITNAANREFSSDTGFWTKSTGVTIADGVCHFTNPSQYTGILRNLLTTIGKYYKVTYTISNYSSGAIKLTDNNAYSGISRNQSGTYVEYFNATNQTIKFEATLLNTALDIDNVSVQEIGWAGSTELYNGIYAQTAGTVEQKTYAAVKASAMWCFFDNDANLGAIYGKLYNWYAVKLLQMDIDYYNAANPSTPWGYRVPTDTDFNNLATALGGASVAGGKMKVGGLTYWGSPNTGGDNSSGFSAIGGGYRIDTGVFYEYTVSARFWSISNFQYLLYNTNLLNVATVPLSRGHSLRLIKS